MDPMSSAYAVPSPYDQQVPSTSSPSCAMARPNTPQTPYGRSAFGSAHASPFRPANAADAVRLRETCAARNAQTAQWMDSQYLAGVSGYHGSGVQSGPCSVMSAASGGGMSMMSGMSQMSLGNMSQLSICTQLTEAHYTQNAAYQTTSGASSVENIDPSNIFEINRQVNTLIMSLRHEDPEIRRKAANSVQSMARQRLLAMVSNHATLRELICHFLQFVLEHTIEQNITQLMQSIFNILNCRTCFVVMQDRYIQQILVHIIAKYLMPDHPFTAWTVIAFTAILRKKDLRGFRRMCRNEYFVRQLMIILGSTSSSHKSLIIDSIRMLITRNLPLKEFFVRSKGMEKLLEFMSCEHEEKVLRSSATTLLTLISTESAKYGIEFVKLGGVQIFGNLLSHGSTMLLHEVLHCLAGVGDLKEALETQDISNTIVSVLQLMGAHDPILVNHGTAFLLNVSANSIRNKASMVTAQAPDTLLSVLNHRNNYLTIPLANVRQLIASITDNVLICLANLTRNQDECGRAACIQIARKPDSAKTLLNVLASGTVECQNRVLMVIHSTCICVAEYKLFFLDTVDDYNQSNLVTFTLRLLWNNFVQYNSFSEAERIHRRKQIDRVLRLLATLSKSEELLQQITAIFREHNPLPLLRPFRTNDFTAHRDFLEFLDILSSNPMRFDLIPKWLSTPESQQILHYYCQFQPDPKLMGHARNIGSRLQQANVEGMQTT
uniref:Armadillo-type fold domain containing protein n=1 Tax=Haemonchus contortus TaxID=6289 RepID=A0A7I5E8M7_HAECO